MSNRAGCAMLVAFAIAALPGCRAKEAALPATAPITAPVNAPASGAVPHGDHNPRHGGIVMMRGDLHYEVVVDPTGRSHQLFFTDAVRDDLPASIASSATVTIRRPGVADDVVPLRIDDTGESWIGSGREVSDRAKATVSVAFTIQGERYSIDLPAATVQHDAVTR
jgi:hypothetical protein